MNSDLDPDALRPLRSGLLAGVPWLRHGFSARGGGVSRVYGRPNDLNLGFTALDDAEHVRENRRRFLGAIAPTGQCWPLVTARQTHSSIVRAVASVDGPQEEADALVSATPSILLGMMTADCVPILLADMRLRVVAVVHAGWRGTAARIVEGAVQRMSEEFGCDPGDLLAAIGPSIGPCCYQVGDEVRRAFGKDWEALRGDRLDLWGANRRQLVAAAVLPDRVETLAECTACARDADSARRFFSHRAEHGRTGRMMAAIGFVGETGDGIG